MRKFLNLLTLFLITFNLNSQDFKYYRYEKDLLTKEFHSDRREEVRKKIPENSVAVLFANPVRNRANDIDYDYHQDPNFYYLTGFNEPNSVLLIYKNSITLNGKKVNEILFVPERKKSDEIWNGRRAGIDGAKIISGIETVFTADNFIYNDEILADTSLLILHLNLHKGVVNDKDENPDLYELMEHFDSLISERKNVDSFKLGKALKELREVKTEEELVLMRRSISMTCKGFISMMSQIRPGMTEYQVQAVGEYEFKKFGAETFGYSSICGSNENSCILHYVSNRRTLNDSDLILLDMGAEYHGYSSDVTRTIPVSGKFTESQRLIYELVQKAQAAGINQCKVGNEFRSTHNAAVEVISEGLVKLGIIKEASEYSRYFMHGTSHYLGLDVHDAGTRGPFKAGTVITVEPGIYIEENSPCDPKWWNIGIRIEDDILITENGPVNLSEAAPRNAEEIEKLYFSGPIINK